MKLFCLTICHKTETAFKRFNAAYNLNSFGYFQRSSVKEFIEFTTKILIERTVASTRASVKEQEYLCHVYVRSDGLAGVLIADHEYPQRVAHTVLNKILDEFSVKYPPQNWPVLKETDIVFPASEEMLEKYQNPKDTDAMMKIQNDLNDTKIILHNTIETVLQRGEKLDDLVEKSEGLSFQSKTFYKTARKTNQCCVIL